MKALYTAKQFHFFQVFRHVVTTRQQNTHAFLSSSLMSHTPVPTVGTSASTAFTTAVYFTHGLGDAS